MSEQGPQSPAPSAGQNTSTQIIIAIIAALGVVGAAIFTNIDKFKSEQVKNTNKDIPAVRNDITASPIINNTPVFNNNYSFPAGSQADKASETKEMIERCIQGAMFVPEGLNIADGLKNQQTLYIALVNNSSDNNLSCVKALIAFGVGANPRSTTYPNQTEDNSPLFAAIQANSVNMVKVLLDAGANPNLRVFAHGADKPGISPLAGSVFKELAIAELLVEHGADVNAPNTNNQTALVRAVMGSKKELVALFLKKGARKDVVEQTGHKTPMQLAEERKDQDIVALLK